MTAREIALLSLSACERQGAWSDGYLKRAIVEKKLDCRDGALATHLCLGVLQNQMLLDFYISHFSTMAIEKMDSRVRIALRLAIYQMTFMSRIPHSAAVNESVELTRKHCKNPRAVGLVNGILRNISRNINALPTIDRQDPIAYLSTRYSHPQWLVEEVNGLLGAAETERFLEKNNTQPAITAQVNTQRTTAVALAEALTAAGVTVEQHPWLPNCLTLSDTGNLEQLEPFQRGEFYIQDVAARLAVTAAGLAPEMSVLDVCAAPGGKSMAAAIDLENRGAILSCDIHANKKKFIDESAQRLGLTVIQSAVMDGKKHSDKLEGAFDAIIADVPCSGLGVIRKKPEIRYKNPKDLGGLPAVQRDILHNVSSYLKPGGVLLFATCTVLPQENENVCQAFLASHPEFQLEKFTLPGPIGKVEEGMITLWPQMYDTDGFFIAKLRKV